MGEGEAREKGRLTNVSGKRAEVIPGEGEVGDLLRTPKYGGQVSNEALRGDPEENVDGGF